MIPQAQHLRGQPSYHCCIEGSHHWGGMCIHYQLSRRVQQRLKLNGGHLEHVFLCILLTFLVHVWEWMMTHPKMSSFYLSINVIFITLSFVVLDLCLIILFKKIVEHRIYIYIYIKQRIFHYNLCYFFLLCLLFLSEYSFLEIFHR